MQIVELTVSRDDVWNEVTKLSGYTGDKLLKAGTDGVPIEDGEAYDRLMLTDESQLDLARFWAYASSLATERLKEWMVRVSEPEEDYHVVLELPNNYDTNLNISVEELLRSYFVNILTAQWFKLCNKGDVEERLTDGESAIGNVTRLILSRRRPKRCLKIED